MHPAPAEHHAAPIMPCIIPGPMALLELFIIAMCTAAIPPLTNSLTETKCQHGGQNPWQAEPVDAATPRSSCLRRSCRRTIRSEYWASDVSHGH
jgi:hypothetical protein